MGRNSILMIAEGLDVFELAVPDSLAGKSIGESGIRSKTGCSVIATRRNGKIEVTLDPNQLLLPGSRLILVGTPESEKRFLEIFKVAD